MTIKKLIELSVELSAVLENIRENPEHYTNTDVQPWLRTDYCTAMAAFLDARWLDLGQVGCGTHQDVQLVIDKAGGLIRSALSAQPGRIPS